MPWIKVNSEAPKPTTFEDLGYVKVVRCKDCKYGTQLYVDYISCELSEENESGCHMSHKSDWFCADGERW